MNSIPTAVTAAFGGANGVLLGEIAYELATYFSATDTSKRNPLPEHKSLDRRMMMAAAATSFLVYSVSSLANVDETYLVMGLEYGAAATLAFLSAKDATSEPGLENFREWYTYNPNAVLTASWRTLAGVAASVGTDAIVRVLPRFFQPARLIINTVVLVGVASADLQKIKENMGFFSKRQRDLSVV